MSISMKAAQKALMRRFAKAAITAALLSALTSFLSAPGAAQGIGGAMPANCQQNLNQCSLQIWMPNSFPRAGYQQRVTFSNRETLTCTSNGANKPRTCTLTGGQQAGGQNNGQQAGNQSGGSQQAGNQASGQQADNQNGGGLLLSNSGLSGQAARALQNHQNEINNVINALDGASPGQQPGNQDSGQQAGNQDGGGQQVDDALASLSYQVVAPHGGTTDNTAACQQLSAQLGTLKNAPDPAANVPNMRALFNTIVSASPDQIDKVIQYRQSVLKASNANQIEVANQAGQKPPPPLQDPVLDWLLNYRTAQILGIGMQDARDEFLRQIDDANKQAAANRAQIQDLQSQMANMGCGAGN